MSNEITLTLGGSVNLNLVLTPPTPEVQCFVMVTYEQFIITAKGTNMAYTLPADHFVKVQVSYVDRDGNPAAVDNIAWSSDPPTIISAQVDGSDPTMVTVTPVGAVGNAQVTATADADLGEGVTALVTTMDITVVAGQAVAGTISPVGPAEPLP